MNNGELAFKHRSILDAMHETYVQKNSDYGNSASIAYDKFGMMAYLIPLTHKMHRLENLTLGMGEQKVADESIEDTLLDIANYCVMAVMDIHRPKDTTVQNLVEYIEVLSGQGDKTHQIPVSKEKE